MGQFYKKLLFILIFFMCSGLRGHNLSKDNSLVASAAGKLLKVTPVTTISFHFYLFDFRKLIHFRLITKTHNTKHQTTLFRKSLECPL